MGYGIVKVTGDASQYLSDLKNLLVSMGYSDVALGGNYVTVKWGNSPKRFGVHLESINTSYAQLRFGYCDAHTEGSDPTNWSQPSGYVRHYRATIVWGYPDMTLVFESFLNGDYDYCNAFWTVIDLAGNEVGMGGFIRGRSGTSTYTNWRNYVLIDSTVTNLGSSYTYISPRFKDPDNLIGTEIYIQHNNYVNYKLKGVIYWSVINTRFPRYISWNGGKYIAPSQDINNYWFRYE